MPTATIDQKWLAGGLLSVLLLLSGWLFNVLIERMNNLQTRVNELDRAVAAAGELRKRLVGMDAGMVRNNETVAFLYEGGEKLRDRINILEREVASVTELRRQALSIRGEISRNTEAVSWLRANCVLVHQQGEQ